MNQNRNKSNSVVGIVVGFIGLIASLIGIFTFVTGNQSLKDIPNDGDNNTQGAGENNQTLTREEAVRQLAEKGVSTNNEWTTYIEVFEGVEMALVPAGCFMMGSEYRDIDERPVHEVCFDEPYWFDVTEVTNGAYGSSGYYDLGDSYPREHISWANAKTHCHSRGARLPTEAEWEYAAVGVDSLIYPWGDEFVEDFVVYMENLDGQPAEVGSRLGGVSWVGAYDLIGNVSEWINDWYVRQYYQTISSKATNPQGPESGEDRVMRGGSYIIFSTANYRAADFFRATARGGLTPDDENMFVGFRCARSNQ